MDRKPQHRISQPVGQGFAVGLVALAIALAVAFLAAGRISSSLTHSAAALLDGPSQAAPSS